MEVRGYDVEAMLGFGATGEVWRAREQATGDVVALKRLRPGADPAALEALRREATLLRRLDTPYVVRLRAVVGDVLVLDHAAGGSLAELLRRRGALDPGEVVTVAVPLASALACAHALGMVHGDVSPANVLFTAEGMPLLADLGVARVGPVPGDASAGGAAAGTDSDGAIDVTAPAGDRVAGTASAGGRVAGTASAAGLVAGTAEYVDPAVAAGGEPDAASDVWALAALCHHLLAGTPPHDGASVGEVLGAAAAGERAPLGLLAPSAPRALVAAVEAGLAHDPASRPDAAAFCALLRRAHATAPVRLSDGPAVHPPPRETHVVRAAAHAAPAARWRLPRTALPAVGLVLLVVCAAVVGWVSGRAETPSVAMAPASGPAPTPRVASPPVTTPVVPEPSGATVPARAAPAPVRPAAPVVDLARDWSTVLTGLDDQRARAFAAGDADLLDEVWAAGSAGLAADRALVASLAGRGRTAHGLRHELREVEVLEGSDRETRLRVVDVLAEHEVRLRDGTVVEQVAMRGSAVWRVRLLAVPGGWRLAEVVPEL